jgi:hypothetical protein
MNYYKGVKLEFNKEKRKNYMSFPDLAPDLTTKCLVEILHKLDNLQYCVSIFKQLENRKDITEKELENLYDTI